MLISGILQYFFLGAIFSSTWRTIIRKSFLKTILTKSFVIIIRTTFLKKLLWFEKASTFDVLMKIVFAHFKRTKFYKNKLFLHDLFMRAEYFNIVIEARKVRGVECWDRYIVKYKDIDFGVLAKRTCNFSFWDKSLSNHWENNCVIIIV